MEIRTTQDYIGNIVYTRTSEGVCQCKILDFIQILKEGESYAHFYTKLLVATKDGSVERESSMPKIYETRQDAYDERNPIEIKEDAAFWNGKGYDEVSEKKLRKVWIISDEKVVKYIFPRSFKIHLVHTEDDVVVIPNDYLQESKGIYYKSKADAIKVKNALLPYYTLSEDDILNKK